MKIRIIKKLVILISIIFLFNIYMSYLNKSFAISDPTKNPDIWISSDIDVGDENLNDKVRPVLGIIRAFGIIASVISLAIIGIKIMYGSVEEKANYKQTLIPWAAGAVMLLAMTTIPSLVYNAIGKEKMVADVEITTKEKVPQFYCINKKEIFGDGVIGVHRTTEEQNQCGCKGELAEGEDYKFKCASCGTRLEKIGKYYYCKKCGTAYK